MKKGVTLIELVVSIGAAVALLSIIVIELLNYNSIRVSGVKSSRDYFYCMEALMFMEHEIDTAKSTGVNNNVIELNYLDETIKKIIRLNFEGKVVLVHIENDKIITSNNIVTGIEEFQAVMKGNTVYLAVKRKDGERYEKCVGIKSEL
jgi:CRISPR/Cas system-associated exonuclease Cas4 (RecB family)